MKNENINNEEYIPLLKTFQINQLEVLYHLGIITKEKFDSLIPKNMDKTNNQTSSESADFIINKIWFTKFTNIAKCFFCRVSEV